MRPRGLVVGGPETPQDRRNQLAHIRGAPDLVRSRPGDQNVARHPLLEQELGRLDDRRRVEAGGKESGRDGLDFGRVYTTGRICNLNGRS